MRLPRDLAPRAFVEPAIAALIFCAGSWLGVAAVRSFRAAGGAQYFYQSEFAPAVMLACGRGLQDPDTRTAPALAAFLSEQSDGFDCAQLAPAIPVGRLNPFQRASEYLEIVVALTWKITGVSWSRLAVLPGLFFGAVAALTYGVLRLGLSRLLALLALVPSLMSTPNFMIVPQLRDYAKGPFLLATILLMGLVAGSEDRRRVIALSALAGAVIGVGLGFRSDLVIAVVPFVVTVALLTPASVTMAARTAAVAAFAAALAIALSPLLVDSSREGSNIGHVALLGLTKDFDGPLRIEPSVYEFGSQYNDSLAFSIINSYAIRVEAEPAGVSLSTPEYDRSAVRYLGQLARVFPADFVTRTAAAVRAIPKYFLDSSLYPPVQARSGFLRELYFLRGRILWRLAPLGFAAVVAATIVIGLDNLRAAWLVVLVLIGFAGASAVQFHERHFYYLQFVPWFAFGVLAQAAMGGAAFLGRLTRRHAARALLVAAVIAVGAGGAILLSRAYQQRAAGRLFGQYETAPRTPLRIVHRRAGDGRTLIAADEWLSAMPSGALPIDTRFLAVQFRDDLCGPARLPITVRYQGKTADVDLSEALAVTLRPQGMSTMLFIPAYDRADESIRFRGIEVAADDARCIGALFHLQGLNRTPLLLTTVLAANWRDGALYQRLR